jgi:hypothetical protein
MDLAECAKWELLESANNTCILNVRFWHKADIQKINHDRIFLSGNITLRTNPLFQKNVLQLVYVVIVAR